MNKPVPAPCLRVALWKSGVYDYNYRYRYRQLSVSFYFSKASKSTGRRFRPLTSNHRSSPHAVIRGENGRSSWRGRHQPPSETNPATSPPVHLYGSLINFRPLASLQPAAAAAAETSYGDEVHSVPYDHSEWVWGVPTGGRQGPTTCVPIPSNLSLCSGIRYDKMRLPNLLDHDSIREVTQQANAWVHLLNIRCHPDTQVFLCSLFAPVCFDRPIWPCRSLCLAVQGGCERRMARYGFSWPEMLRCERFPPDNDLCINVLSETSGQ